MSPKTLSMFGLDPNMTGEFASLYSHWTGLSGVFSESDTDSQCTTANFDNKAIAFNASDGNSLYLGDKLQVAALTTLACIKT